MIFLCYASLILLTKDRTKRTTNTKNRILAIPAELPAIPPKPKMAVIKAIIINTIVQRNISLKLIRH